MKNQRLEGFFFFLFTLVIFGYLIARAALSATLNDEAFTFLKYVHSNSFLPFIPSSPVSANNHYFNSILTWLSYQTFGITEWALRLPNLIAFLIYMLFLFRLGKFLSTSYLRWFFWILLTGVHYYLEFFGYCRGYGLSLAFLAGSMFHLIKADQNNTHTTTNLFWGLILLFLAAFSNLNLMVTFALWFAVSLKVAWCRRSNLKHFALYTGFGILLFWFLTALSLELKAHEQQPIGHGGIMETLGSMVSFFSGSQSETYLYIYSGIVVIMLIVGGIFIIKKFTLQLSPLLTFYVFLCANIMGSFVLHYVMEVNYPIARTAFHWYFFAAGTLVFTLNELHRFYKPLFTVSTFILFIPLFIFTLESLNLRVSVDPQWARQQISDDIYFKTIELNQKHSFPLSMYAPENFYTVSMAFKTLKYKTPINVCHVFPYLQTVYSSDLLIIDTTRYPDCTDYYDPVYYDESSTMFLMKRKELLQGALIGESQKLERNINDEFVMLGEFEPVDLSSESVYRINIDLELLAEEKTLLSLLTLEVWDTTQSVVFYDQISLDYLSSDFSTGVNQKLSFLLHNLTPEVKKIRCNFWNYRKNTVDIMDARLSFHKLSEPQ